MPTYPIYISKYRPELRFPDFPGCSVPCPIPKDLAEGQDETQARLDRARKLATWYLVGSHERPGWIVKRLKDGYAVPMPGTYELGSQALHELEVQIVLPEEIETALGFHWLPSILECSHAQAAQLLGITEERLEALEHARARPNHKELARMRFAVKKSYTRLRVQADSESTPQEAAS